MRSDALPGDANGHPRDRHRSQDGKTWGTAPELPGCASCGATDVEDTGEHEAQTGHRFVTDPDPEPEEPAVDVQALILEALTEPTFGPASDHDAAQYWANLARKLARAVSPVVVSTDQVTRPTLAGPPATVPADCAGGVCGRCDRCRARLENLSEAHR